MLGLEIAKIYRKSTRDEIPPKIQNNLEDNLSFAMAEDVNIEDKYGCRCKASIVKRRGQVIYELVREPDV